MAFWIQRMGIVSEEVAFVPRSDAVYDFICLYPPMLALRNVHIDKDSGALAYPKST